MKIIVNPCREQWGSIVQRNVIDDAAIGERVSGIIDEVRTGGDAALRRLTESLDGVRLDSLEVSAADISASERSLSSSLRQAVEIAAANIWSFHERQTPGSVRVETSPGVVCVQRPVPIQKVGLYVPGGSAPLFSTVLMLAIPASIAGCPEVVLCTPPRKDGSIAPETLYAASVCGVNRIFKVGGAQAVAAMAYGTETVPAVDKIFGPGNRYVTKAKQLVAMSQAAIDMPAGPSEVLVMADSTARADFVAADMLSQAEHGPDSQCILVTDDMQFAISVNDEIDRQARELPRNEMVGKSLQGSSIVVLDSRDEMIAFANAYAAEHLIISMSDAWKVAQRITAAGSIFIGNYSPESAGDYASGTNHTLPTAGWARSYSGVNVESFMRRMTIQELSREGLATLAGTITAMARAEGLEAHAKAVDIRLKESVK